MLTTLRRTVVFAGSRGTRAGATRLLDAQRPALVDFALKALLGSISLIRSNHLDESEATGLLRVGVTHDVAFLHLAVFLEQTTDFLFRQAGVNTRDEEVGARVAAIIIVTAARVLGRAAVFCQYA